MVCWIASVQAQHPDFGNTGRYAKANKALPAPTKGEKRVILFGNSITEGWVNLHPEFFKRTGFIGRGISGQTSYQFLLRFREDVVKLNPKLVVINAGTNDIAENVCDYNEELTLGNIISMVEIAKAHKIKVILTSVLPAANFSWRPKIKDAPQKIASLNRRIEAYAKANKIPYVDYFPVMADDDGISLKAAYAKDSVHPNTEGYKAMESVIEPAIKKAL